MYYFVFGVLYLLSLLPLRLLYLFSDLAYVLLYYIVRYRRTVVRVNLAHAFPEKTPGERTRIEKRFYRNFADNFIEVLKLFSGGPSFANAHFVIDPRLMQQQFDKGHRVQFHLGHHFNWELANLAVTRLTSFPMLMVYLPVENQVFDRLMLRIRSSSGNHLLPANQLRQKMFAFRKTQYLLALIADQVPADASTAYWLNFFNRPTPFLKGPERGAVAGGLAVMFGHISKSGRGRYQLHYELATENASSLSKGELTRRYARFLENAIREHPDMWLWSHRRWKKPWTPEYANLWIDESPLPAEVNTLRD